VDDFFVPSRLSECDSPCSLALTESGAVAAWGSNADGQIGVGMDALPCDVNPALVFGPGSPNGNNKAARYSTPSCPQIIG
jgi:hypothetical protein